MSEPSSPHGCFFRFMICISFIIACCTAITFKHHAALSRFDLQKELTKLRQTTTHLQDVEHIYQDAAIHQARTAADTSNKYGNGNLKFRSKKRGRAKVVECDVSPAYVNNYTAPLPGLGHARLDAEQPYQYLRNWLYGARLSHTVMSNEKCEDC